MVLELERALKGLRRARPIFHSEADFQHALAWSFHEQYPAAKVRLEYKPFPDKPLYVDIWVNQGNATAAIELKYLTRKTEVTVDGELFALKQQSAQDTRRYDVLKDLERLESISSAIRGVVGYAVVLTNDQAYWQPSRNPETIDAAFRLHEGRVLTGTLAWNKRASAGTIKGRERPLTLTGSYTVTWQPYSKIESARNSEFRYHLHRIQLA